ncbi:MAG: hypothetical protein DMG71_03400 [Acidobacteria bacterium]|nr:MAG: hypothetical protein DMG71_03400 [Acidobacteriota bacterium]
MGFRTLAFLLLTLSVGATAQSRGTGGGKPSVPTTPSTTNPSNVPSPPRLDTNRSFFLSGKVRADDGTPLTDAPTIQSLCKGRIRTEAYTDSKGNFSFEVSRLKERELGGVVGDAIDSSSSLDSRASQGSIINEWKDCELQALLPGFTSQVVELASRMQDFGNIDVGTIVLHRLQQVEGFTISATSAGAPSKAKKDYEKGREFQKQQKWDAALEKFGKAVELYPQYAVAWVEMGRVQEQKKDPSSARQSFHRAVSADPKFITPYQELAQLAFHDQQWQELLETTTEILRLNPVNFPQHWFLNATANYYLQHYDAAEQSAIKGIQVDREHRVPQLEQVLGVVLAKKHDYHGALDHIRKYLALAPNAADAEVAQKQAQELERLSAQAQSKQPN